MKGKWTCFRWALGAVPDPVSLQVDSLSLRRAEPGEDVKVLTTAASAAAMDSSLGDAARELAPVFEISIDKAFQEKEPPVLVVLHGSRMVGVSVFDASAETENHLLTGPCVLHEYGSRGIASWLLAATLVELRGLGMESARGVARERSVLARYIYPKFGSEPHPCDFPGPAAPAKTSSKKAKKAG